MHLSKYELEVNGYNIYLFDKSLIVNKNEISFNYLIMSNSELGIINKFNISKLIIDIKNKVVKVKDNVTNFEKVMDFTSKSINKLTIDFDPKFTLKLLAPFLISLTMSNSVLAHDISTDSYIDVNYNFSVAFDTANHPDEFKLMKEKRFEISDTFKELSNKHLNFLADYYYDIIDNKVIAKKVHDFLLNTIVDVEINTFEKTPMGYAHYFKEKDLAKITLIINEKNADNILNNIDDYDDFVRNMILHEGTHLAGIPLLDGHPLPEHIAIAIQQELGVELDNDFVHSTVHLDEKYIANKIESNIDLFYELMLNSSELITHDEAKKLKQAMTDFISKNKSYFLDNDYAKEAFEHILGKRTEDTLLEYSGFSKTVTGKNSDFKKVLNEYSLNPNVHIPDPKNLVSDIFVKGTLQTLILQGEKAELIGKYAFAFERIFQLDKKSLLNYTKVIYSDIKKAKKNQEEHNKRVSKILSGNY